MCELRLADLGEIGYSYIAQGSGTSGFVKSTVREGQSQGVLRRENTKKRDWSRVTYGELGLNLPQIVMGETRSGCGSSENAVSPVRVTAAAGGQVATLPRPKSRYRR